MVKEIICRIGKYDVPVIQKQPDFNINLLQSNVALIGSPQSGKSNLIRLIINILHKKMNAETEQIFILDFSGALAEYQKMPLVSAYFDNSNEEYVKRVFKILEGKLKENTKALEGVGFARKTSGQPRHITFLIDNFNAFLDEPRYAGYQEKFARLCRDGISKGISIVITASELKGMGSYLNNFSQKIAVNLQDDKYSEIFGRKVSSIGNIPGRGFANVTVKFPNVTGTYDVNAPYEIHCSFAEPLDSEPFQTKLREKYRYDAGTGEFLDHVEKFKIFPRELTPAAFADLLEGSPDPAEGARSCVSVGLDYVDFKPVVCDFRLSRFLAIYAKRDFGREELLNRLVTELMAGEPSRKLVLFDDGRGALEQFRTLRKDAVYIRKFEEKDVQVFAEAAVPSAQGRPEPVRSAAAASFIGKSADPVPEPQSPVQRAGFHTVQKKLSPMQQFYQYVHEKCMDIGNFAGMLYTGSEIVYRERSKKIPAGCMETGPDPTLFVIQSKLAYSSVSENKQFMEHILPMLADIAEERDYIFIFSDVRKMSDHDMNEKFNTLVRSLFVLDNIAEFVAERGQRTILGDMDVKMLKSDYAKCEFGDGYYYDVEADNLKKFRMIQEVS